MKLKLHLLLSLLVLALSATLTGCADDGPPYPDFTDDRLIGTWQLIGVNGTPVSEWETNYLRFDGQPPYSDMGMGLYGYYSRGQLMVEDMWYVCSNYGGPRGQQITIEYESGQNSTMNYWFSDSETLVMQWDTAGGSITYTYALTDDIL